MEGICCQRRRTNRAHYSKRRYNEMEFNLWYAYLCPGIPAYRHPIEKFMADRKNDIRELELSEDEWVIVKQLNEVLMVHGCATHGYVMSSVELFTSASHLWVAQVNSCEKLAQKWLASASYSFPTGRHEYEYGFCAARVLAGKLVGLCRRPSTAIFLHTH